MTFIKILKRLQSNKAQVYLEYCILFVAATVGIMSFLWFSWGEDATQARAEGKARTALEGYYAVAQDKILGDYAP